MYYVDNAVTVEILSPCMLNKANLNANLNVNLNVN